MKNLRDHGLVERLTDECIDLYKIVFHRRQHLKPLLDPSFRTGELKRAIEEQRTARGEMEVAVDRILGAAERMMTIDFSNPEAAATEMSDCCGEIMEACSFQDITGQRLSQTIETLRIVDKSLDALDGDCASADETPNELSDESLLNGPALPGNGLGQDSVDALLAAGKKP
ncbi:MAG: protein phosphatase CheZ [Parvibaculum sp.]|uniref:protein phosphatase CheZ n=1 Tax=Parvibaculum sp. TaxID=2024848 RepID=UPI002724F876|nr:protein phosphatase CheZ [Parvibaculum sp.]MDO8839226.1 protein phosphatase CheZ [Parvibaculum sp.]